MSEYQKEHPQAEVIRLGIGDVTQPLVPAIIEALHNAVEEMGTTEGFHGYGPEQGYEFLRECIAREDYQNRGCPISAEEIFISDGAKQDVVTFRKSLVWGIGWLSVTLSIRSM